MVPRWIIRYIMNEYIVPGSIVQTDMRKERRKEEMMRNECVEKHM